MYCTYFHISHVGKCWQVLATQPSSALHLRLFWVALGNVYASPRPCLTLCMQTGTRSWWMKWLRTTLGLWPWRRSKRQSDPGCWTKTLECQPMSSHVNPKTQDSATASPRKTAGVESSDWDSISKVVDFGSCSIHFLVIFQQKSTKILISPGHGFVWKCWVNLPNEIAI